MTLVVRRGGHAAEGLRQLARPRCPEQFGGDRCTARDSALHVLKRHALWAGNDGGDLGIERLTGGAETRVHLAHQADKRCLAQFGQPGEAGLIIDAGTFEVPYEEASRTAAVVAVEPGLQSAIGASARRGKLLQSSRATTVNRDGQVQHQLKNRTSKTAGKNRTALIAAPTSCERRSCGDNPWRDVQTTRAVPNIGASPTAKRKKGWSAELCTAALWEIAGIQKALLVA